MTEATTVLRPTGPNILVKPDVQTSASGIVIPDSKTKPSTSGIVERVGEHAHGFLAGQRVFFDAESKPTAVRHGGADFLLMPDYSVMAIEETEV